MNELIFKTINLLASKQFQLESIRQLLCEQVQFVPYQAYLQTLDEDASSIDLYCLLNFLGKQCDNKALESLLKFYSDNQLKLDYDQFEDIVMTRQDYLLKKLTRERKVDQNVLLPQFINNYLLKLWKIEEQLHHQLNLLKNQTKRQYLQAMEIFKIGHIINEQLLKDNYLLVAEHTCEECPLINFELAMRYIKKGFTDADITFDFFVSLFISKNCTTIHNYLANKKVEQKLLNQTLKNGNPFLHKQFFKLKPIKTESHSYCFRQIKSVQEHFRRTQNIPSSPKLATKIKQYGKKLQGQLKKFFKQLKKIIKLSKTLELTKQNLGIFNCRFASFFEEITDNKSIVPSQLQHYLRSVGIEVQLSELFVLFKRHGDAITGKITAKHFTRIFTHEQEMQIDEYEPLCSQFRKSVIECLLEQIKQETKIEKLKRQLNQQISLRQIFDCLDVGKTGKISRTDFQVCIKNIAKDQLTQRQTEIFWSRMNRSLNEYIDYDTFMWAMLPRTRKKPAAKVKDRFS